MSENKMIVLWSVIIIVLLGFFYLNPMPYKLESAKGLGDAVRIGTEVYNQANLDKFVESVAAKKTADIRVVNYNEANQAVIYRMAYDGYNIKLTIDARRDKSIKDFWKIYKSIYASIEKVQGVSGAEYFLTIPESEKKLIFSGK